MSRRVDLLLIGPHAPPAGGVSVHVARLAERATGERLLVAVVSPYRIDDRKLSVPYPVLAGRGNGPRRFVACVIAVGQRSASVAHFHVSGLRRIFAIAVLRAVVPGHTRTVLTVHSGSWPSGNTSPRWRRIVEGWLLRRFDALIAVNERQALELRRMCGDEGKVTVIPAFLSGNRGNLHPLAEAAVTVAAEHGRKVVVLSGYGTPLYRYEDALAAVRACIPAVECEVILALYNTYDAEYLRRLEHVMPGLHVHIIRDMSPGEFLAVLAHSAVYVRAAERDGDSVAVREALAAGVPVIASDAAVRPVGAAVYPLGDVARLASELRGALTNRRDENAAVSSNDVDAWTKIRALYGDPRGHNA